MAPCATGPHLQHAHRAHCVGVSAQNPGWQLFQSALLVHQRCAHALKSTSRRTGAAGRAGCQRRRAADRVPDAPPNRPHHQVGQRPVADLGGVRAVDVEEIGIGRGVVAAGVLVPLRQGAGLRP